MANAPKTTTPPPEHAPAPGMAPANPQETAQGVDTSAPPASGVDVKKSLLDERRASEQAMQTDRGPLQAPSPGEDDGTFVPPQTIDRTTPGGGWGPKQKNPGQSWEKGSDQDVSKDLPPAGVATAVDAQGNTVGTGGSASDPGAGTGSGPSGVQGGGKQAISEGEAKTKAEQERHRRDKEDDHEETAQEQREREQRNRQRDR
jgi:hypothetical protein